MHPPYAYFGFIAPDGGDDDAFLHITAAQAAGPTGLKENQKRSSVT
ncbi:MAG: cold shock domain-containing protein [Pseudomonadota bacterium]